MLKIYDLGEYQRISYDGQSGFPNNNDNLNKNAKQIRLNC